MRKVFYSALLLISFASLAVVLQPKTVAVEMHTLARGPFDETLVTEGKIRSRDRLTVYAQASGNIESLKVKLGDPVKKGQLITRLDWDRTILVTSPMDGVISKLNRDSAGPVMRGEPIFEVSNVSDLEVVAELLTPDAVRLSPGGEVKVLNWGGEGVLPARISRVSRAGMVKTSALGVEEERTEVHANFDRIPTELQSRLGDNYHVDITFMISHEADALAVPLGALFRSRERWAVFVVDGGRARLREISISKKNDQQAMVAEGLRAGERVILFPGDKIREGMRVRGL